MLRVIGVLGIILALLIAFDVGRTYQESRWDFRRG